MGNSSRDTMTIAERFFAAAEKYADQPAVGMAGDDAYLTYRQLANAVRETAVFIGKTQPGEPIGLLSENRPAWGKIYMAILACGGVVVPVDSLLKKEELATVVAESSMTRMFVSPRYYDLAVEVSQALGNKIKIYNLEAIAATDTDIFKPCYAESLDERAILIFTSGTTGKSKKVILTHDNILSDLDGFMRRLQFGPGDRFLSVLPLHHTFEATCGFITPVLHGCAIYYVKAINSREILNGIKKHRVTHFISVPLLYEKLYHGILNAVKKAPATKRAIFGLSMTAAKSLRSMVGVNVGGKLFTSLRKKAGLDTIRMMVSGGAPLPVEIAKAFDLLGLKLIEGYGLTETSPVISVNPTDKIKFGSVGLPLDNIEVKLASPNEKGVGELLVRGPITTPGYEDNPEATAELISDGWLHTGDMARIDSDGYIYIMGREKNLIVSAAGKNIYPEEIEAALAGSSFIMEAMVWGRKMPNGREEVAAKIYPDFEALSEHLGKESDDITDDDIAEIIAPEIKSICSRMADFKRIKHVEYLREEMEKTSSKKIKRFVYQK